MRKLFTLFALISLVGIYAFAAEGGTMSCNPGGNVINPAESVTITYDGTGTNFANWDPKCHVHLWLVAKEGSSFTQEGGYATSWLEATDKLQGDAFVETVPANRRMTWVTKGKYELTIDNLYTFFGVSEVDKPKVGQLGIIVLAQYLGESNKTKDLFLSVDDPAYQFTPLIALNGLPEHTFIDETITWSATSENVTDPLYTYSVKTPGSTEYVSANSPYQPEATGTYTFKATVAESSAPATVLATDKKEVIVMEVPDPITIKVKVPAEWGGEAISFWNWNEYTAGSFVTASQVGEWYTYTFERMSPLNLIVVNGTDWAGEDKSQQTVNIEGVSSSTCYQVGEPEFPETGDYGKRVVTTIDCSSGPSTSLEVQEVQSSVLVDGGRICASFDGMKQVRLFSVSGQMLYAGMAEGTFAYPAVEGVYLLHIGQETHKVMVR